MYVRRDRGRAGRRDGGEGIEFPVLADIFAQRHGGSVQRSRHGLFMMRRHRSKRIRVQFINTVNLSKKKDSIKTKCK